MELFSKKQTNKCLTNIPEKVTKIVLQISFNLLSCVYD